MELISSLILIPVLLLATLTTAARPATSYDHYLLSCGAPVSVSTTPSDWDNQTWHSDNNSTLANDFSSTTAASTTTGFNAPHVPFASARVFTTNFTYSFPVSPGPKIIRLFFYPSTSPYTSSSPARLSLPSTEAYLSVEAVDDSTRLILLLHNFSASLSRACSPHQQESVVQKEFYLHVSNSLLRLTFFPTAPASHAFINGIEVVSVPESLYVNGPLPPKNIANPAAPFQLSPTTTALENVYRLNVGGNDVSVDSGMMYRRWLMDSPYLIGNIGIFTGFNDRTILYTRATPSDIAPMNVYQTFRAMGNLISKDMRKKVNVTWRFDVDLGFFYLVRLHWCEVVVDVNAKDYRVFDVYIDEQLAEEAVDIVGWVHGQYTPVYRDYIVFMDGNGRGALQLDMHPNTKENYKYTDILLNGLEIFKINRANGSLDGPNPSCPPVPASVNPPLPPKSVSHTIPIIIGVGVAGVILLVLPLFYLFIFQRRRRRLQRSSASEIGTRKSSRGASNSSLPTHLCRHFTLVEIRDATSDFSNSLIVGHGGFGNVYKGVVATEAGPTTVAIKRLNPLSGQGAKEFTTEIELLSKLRHVNLVSLIGYCDEAREMILIYEYMSRGTLRDHLYPPHNNTDPEAQLSWRTRLEACIGAARGLHYLHTGTDRMIIHRDVKSTNILLAERWAAKVSDFGLSKLGPAGGELSHVSTAVKGSIGYLDPEYYRRQQLTEKSDVYSFGVLLFEVLCGRAAVNPNLPKEQVNLRIWARRNQMSGTLDAIVDPTVKGQIVPECLRKFGEVAESCVRDEGANRPSMADVIGGLELALQLQLESSSVVEVIGQDIVVDEYTPDEEFQPIDIITSPTTDASVRLLRSPGESTGTSINNSMSSRLFSSTTSESYGESPAVFSQIFKPEGR